MTEAAVIAVCAVAAVCVAGLCFVAYRLARIVERGPVRIEPTIVREQSDPIILTAETDLLAAATALMANTQTENEQLLRAILARTGVEYSRMIRQEAKAANPPEYRSKEQKLHDEVTSMFGPKLQDELTEVLAGMGDEAPYGLDGNV